MNKKGYIDKKKKGTGVYEELHLEGLEILQKLSGSIWTDYNEHDPGVTILENVSYALTELLHKTEFPIQDLLLQKEDQELQSGDNGLFVASDILTTDPITFNDYRKLWIDQIENVKNIWIHPVNTGFSGDNSLKGLLYVYVEKYTYQQEPAEELEENQRIIKEVTALYHQHRNLCESLYKVEVYEPLFLQMELQVSLTEDTDGEEVLATILNEVNDYLTPEVNYYPLWQLQEKGMDVNEIFNGPNLENGFILDEDLKEPLDEILISDIIKIISKIKGIRGIQNFRLVYEDKNKKKIPIKNRFKVSANTAPVVLFPETNENLIFENSGVYFKPDLDETKKQLSFIEALDFGSFKAASNSLNDLPIPKGTYQEIDTYYPIRKQFPLLYGIGDMGISNGATSLRKAQVKQLQSYLMPLDQLMMNFLSQLRNINTLFDVHGEAGASYFTKELPDVAELWDLITPQDLTDKNIDVTSYWKSFLENITANFDTDAIDRHDQIADTLLARYSEEFKTYSLRKINSSSYGEALTSEHFEKKALALKRNFIASYDQIGYTRARSFNYLELSENKFDATNEQFIPGLFRKIAMLMGISEYRIRPLTKVIKDFEIGIHPKEIEVSVILKEIDIHTPFRDITIEIVENIEIKEVHEDLHKVMHFVGSERSILTEVLKKGVLQQNYSIKKDKKQKDKYYVFYHRNTEKSNIAHISDSKGGAESAIKKTIEHLVTINTKSEGFFAVEHLLLLPPYHQDHFGFMVDLTSFIGASLRIQHVKLTSCYHRNQTITKLVDGMTSGVLSYKMEEFEGCYRLKILSDDGEALAISQDLFDTTDQYQKVIESLKNKSIDISKEQLSDTIACYVYYGENPVSEDFFSFKQSIILPNWPVRFQNESFRMMFENTVYEQTPIHLGTEVHWLDYETMDLFEVYYFKWLETLKDVNASEDIIYQAYQLITMLQELEQQRNEF